MSHNCALKEAEALLKAARPSGTDPQGLIRRPPPMDTTAQLLACDTSVKPRRATGAGAMVQDGHRMARRRALSKDGTRSLVHTRTSTISEGAHVPYPEGCPGA